MGYRKSQTKIHDANLEHAISMPNLVVEGGECPFWPELPAKQYGMQMASGHYDILNIRLVVTPREIIFSSLETFKDKGHLMKKDKPYRIRLNDNN